MIAFGGVMSTPRELNDPYEAYELNELYDDRDAVKLT